MADRTERAVLNSLIVACRDADRGFTFAAERVLDSTLRTFFEDLAKERRHYAEALLPHAQRLGGVVEPQQAGIQAGLQRLHALATAAA